MKYAIITDGVVTNIIWLYSGNAEDFKGVQHGNLINVLAVRPKSEHVLSIPIHGIFPNVLAGTTHSFHFASVSVGISSPVGSVGDGFILRVHGHADVLPC